MATVNELIIQVNAEIGDVSKKLSQVQKEVIDLGKNTKKGGEQASESFINLKNVAETALGFGVANAAGIAADAVRTFVVNGVKDAMKFQEAIIALNIQTGNSANKLLDQMKVASQGFATSLQLANSANRALSLGISKDLLPSLTETAVSIAKIQGLDVGETINTLSNAVGRLSPRMLLSLGIVVDETKAYKEYADAQGITIEQISEQTKRTILLNEVQETQKTNLIQLAIAQDTMADKVDRTTTSMLEMAQSFGGSILTGLTVVIDEMSLLPLSVKQANDEWAVNHELLVQAADDASMLNKALGDANNQLSKYSAELKKLTGGGQTDEQEQINAQISAAKYKKNQLEQLYKVNRTQDGGFNISATGGTIKDVEGNEQVLTRQQVIEQMRSTEQELLSLENQKTQQALALDAIQSNKLIKLKEEGKIENDNIAKSTADLITKFKEVDKNMFLQKLSIEGINGLESLRTAEADKYLKKQQDIEASLTRQQIKLNSMAGGGSSFGYSSKDNSTFGISTISETTPKTTTAKNDFIMRPGQGAVPFSSDDTIVGIKNINGGANTQGNTININIESLSGIDAKTIAEQLRTQLYDLIQY